MSVGKFCAEAESGSEITPGKIRFNLFRRPTGIFVMPLAEDESLICAERRKRRSWRLANNESGGENEMSYRGLEAANAVNASSAYVEAIVKYNR